MVVIFLTVFFNVDTIPGKRGINNAMFQWIKYSLTDITACDFEYSFKVINKNIKMNVAVIQGILIVFFWLLARRQLHSLYAHHSAKLIWPSCKREPRRKGRSQSISERVYGIRTVINY